MKKARSKLLRELDECERSSQRWKDQMEEIERETQRARRAQHLAPCHLLRYETANQRQLYGALHELERLQGLRRGRYASKYYLYSIAIISTNILLIG